MGVFRLLWSATPLLGSWLHCYSLWDLASCLTSLSLGCLLYKMRIKSLPYGIGVRTRYRHVCNRMSGSKWKSLSRVQLFATPWTIQSMEFFRPQYWSGSLSLLQRIFPTQGLNPRLPHGRWILYQLSHKGSPRILEWVAYPFSRGSSWPSNQTRVSCIAERLRQI